MPSSTHANGAQSPPTKPSAKFKVEVVYCAPTGPERQVVDLVEDSTVDDALQRARFLERFKDMDLSVNRVGIFGTLVTLQTKLRPGDRVEVYRPITCDPKTVPRRTAEGDDPEG